MKEVWRVFEPCEMNMAEGAIASGSLTLYKDGTYRFSDWDFDEHSEWSFKHGCLYVRHPQHLDPKWLCCNQPGTGVLNQRIALELAIDAALEDKSETIKLRRIVI